MPWLFVLINQINTPHGNGLKSFDMLFCFLCFSCYQNNIILYILTIALLVVVCLLLLYSNFKGKLTELKNGDSIIPYVVIGLITFFGTVLLGAVILPILFAPIAVRYLVPLSGIIWFSISVLVGAYEKNKALWLVALVLIVVLGCANFATEVNASHTLYDTSMTEKQLLEELNTDDTIIIYGSRFIYLTHHYELNNTHAYALKNLYMYYDVDYKVQKNITKILEENPDKDVYIIKTVKNKNQSNFGNNIKSKKVGTTRGEWIIKLELDN